MSHIEAIYHRGVFEPLEPGNLREDQRVQLSFEPAKGQSPQAWLNLETVPDTVVCAGP